MRSPFPRWRWANGAAWERIALTGSIRRRLQELGFVRGTPVQSLYDAPSGSPRAFGIRGAVIALRRSDCAMISVTPWQREDI